MVCKLTILKADSERLPLATPKLSGILGSGYSPGRNVPSSRLDSVRRSDERFLSADPEFEMLGPTVLGVGRRSLIEHGDSRSSSGVSDSDDESRGTESGIYSEEKIDFKRLVDSDKCSKIFVAEMSFSPKSLIVREGEEIYFINMGKSAVGISCGQEFQDVCLAPNSKPFVHVFNLVGEFFVVNLVYTFVKCPIIVKADVKQPVSLISDDLLQDSLPRPPMVTTGILGKPPRLMGSSAAFLKPLTTSTLAESSKNTEMLLGGFQKTNAAHSSASNMKIFDQLMEDVNKESQRKSVDVESKLDISQLKRPQTIASNISQTKVTAPAFNIFGKISPPKLKGSFPDIISVDEISKASESISETQRDVDYLDLMEMQPLADETETKKKKKKKKKKKRKSKSASSAVAMENADSEDEKETDDVIVSLQESAKNFYNPDGREQIKTIESIISEGVEAHQLENLTGPALPSWSSRPDRYRCFITPKFRSTGRESPFNDESINASISSVDIEEKNETEIDNFPVSSDHISYVVNEPTIIESKDEISAGVVHEEFLSMDDFIVVDKKKKKDKSKKVSQPQRIAVATESNSLDLSFEEELRMAIELSKLNSLEDEKGKSLIEFVNLTTDPTDKIKETELAVDAAKRKASELILTIERERLEALSCLETKVLLKKSAIEAAAMEKRVLADKDVLDAYAKADEDLAMITAEALAKAEAIKLKADKDAEDEISRANKKASQLKAKADKRAQYAKITVGKDADIALDALTSEINEEKKVIEKSVSDRIAEARAEAEATTKTYEDVLVQLAKLLEEKATKELEEKAALAKAQEDVLVTDVPEKVDMNKTPKIRGKKSNSDEISSTQNSQDVQNSGKKTSPKKCIPDQKVTSKPDRSGGLKFSDEREEGNAYDEKRKENVEIFEFSVETKNVVIETAEVSYDAIIVDSQSMIHPCTAATDSSLSKSTISHCIQPDTSDTDLKGAHEGKKMKEKKKSKKGSLEKVVATEEINKDFIFVGSDEQISNMEIPTAISKENNLLTSFYQMELLLCQRMDILQSLIEHKEDGIFLHTILKISFAVLTLIHT